MARRILPHAHQPLDSPFRDTRTRAENPFHTLFSRSPRPARHRLPPLPSPLRVALRATAHRRRAADGHPLRLYFQRTPIHAAASAHLFSLPPILQRSERRAIPRNAHARATARPRAPSTLAYTKRRLRRAPRPNDFSGHHGEELEENSGAPRLLPPLFHPLCHLQTGEVGPCRCLILRPALQDDARGLLPTRRREGNLLGPMRARVAKRAAISHRPPSQLPRHQRILRLHTAPSAPHLGGHRHRYFATHAIRLHLASRHLPHHHAGHHLPNPTGAVESVPPHHSVSPANPRFLSLRPQCLTLPHIPSDREYRRGFYLLPLTPTYHLV